MTLANLNTTIPRTARTGRLQLRIIAVSLIAAACLVPGALGEITRSTLIDAYLGVSVFVATTLLIAYGLEAAFGIDTADWLRRNRRLQIPVAAILGALPGCAGAVMVAAAYSSRTVSLGAMVAALTATMGDAAFLLIATRPDAAAVLLPVSVVAGVISGWAVDRVGIATAVDPVRAACDSGAPIPKVRARDFIFLGIALPGVVLGLMEALSIDTSAILGRISPVVGLIGAGVTLGTWMLSSSGPVSSSRDPLMSRVSEETSFIFFWVTTAFLGYAWLDLATSFDIGQLFHTLGVLTPLVAILVGFIPGCGPQIVVTSSFLNGAIPFSALVGNAISNDGDALFPALALAPRAAIAATFITAVPAMITAYAFYFFAPGFMN